MDKIFKSKVLIISSIIFILLSFFSSSVFADSVEPQYKSSNLDSFYSNLVSKLEFYDDPDYAFFGFILKNDETHPFRLFRIQKSKNPDYYIDWRVPSNGDSYFIFKNYVSFFIMDFDSSGKVVRSSFMNVGGYQDSPTDPSVYYSHNEPIVWNNGVRDFLELDKPLEMNLEKVTEIPVLIVQVLKVLIPVGLVLLGIGLVIYLVKLVIYSMK